MTVSLALFDYIPVTLFLIAAVILQRCLYNKMSKGAFALFSSGTIFVFISGFYKATWKLLYAAGICDFEKLNKGFMPMQSTAFMLAGIAIFALLLAKQETKDEPLYMAAAPALFSGTIIFVLFDCIGIAGFCGGLAVIASKMKKKSAIPFFILSGIGLLGMGYLASRNSDSAMMNWIEEIVNCVAEGSLLTGTLILKKAGLKEFRLLGK